MKNSVVSPTQYVKKSNQYYESSEFLSPKISFFTDASVKKDTHIAGYGISDETMLISFRKKILTKNNNLAEITAISEAISLAKLMNLEYLEIFTDCLPALEQIKRYNIFQKSSEIFLPILKEITQDLVFFKGYKICWIPRHRNSFADKLAESN